MAARSIPTDPTPLPPMQPAVPADAPVRRAIGVPEIAAMLGGEIDATSAAAAGATATRQYAKRQYTWFRNQPPENWIRTSETETSAQFEQLAILLQR